MSEDTLSRRSFLKFAGVTLAAAFLESCGLKPVVGSVDASIRIQLTSLQALPQV